MGEQATDRTSDIVKAMLEEYKSLRDESLTSIRNQMTIIGFGIAGLAGFLGFSAKNLDGVTDLNVIAYFCFFIPFYLFAILIIWLGELKRSIRVGNYLSTLESRLSQVLDFKGAINWETWLRQERRRISLLELLHGRITSPGVRSMMAAAGRSKALQAVTLGTNQMTANYLFVIALFMFTALASIIVGIVEEPHGGYFFWPLVALIGYVISAGVVYLALEDIRLLEIGAERHLSRL